MESQNEKKKKMTTGVCATQNGSWSNKPLADSHGTQIEEQLTRFLFPES